MKYKGNLTGSSFNAVVARLMKEDTKTIPACANCVHHNEECEEWARQGKCRMYNFYYFRFWGKEL